MSAFNRFLLIIALTCMWSPSFLFIKLALISLPPITLAASRVSLSSLLLLTLLLARKEPLPRQRSFWLNALIMAFFSSALPFCLFSFAEQSIDSSLAAMLNATTPIFTAVLAHFFVAEDAMNRTKVTGIAISTLGIALLLGPSVAGSFTGPSLAILAALFASLSYAISHIYGKKFCTRSAPFVGPAAQMIASSTLLLPVATLVETPYAAITSISTLSLIGICGLSLMGTVLAFTLYYKLLEVSGPTAISMVACFFPIGGMLLGYLFLGETLNPQQLASASLVIFGVMLVNELPMPRLIKATA